MAGATGTSYTPRADDVGKSVRVEVTGSRTDYPTVTTASTESAAVNPAYSLDEARHHRDAEGGEDVEGTAGLLDGGPTFSYAWYANGKKIKHQSGAKLRLTKVQKGKRITVKVTGKKPGYTTVSKTSARTLKVR